jgi:predicted small integral membrane protein
MKSKFYRVIYVAALALMVFGVAYYEFALTGGNPRRLLYPSHHVGVLGRLLSDPLFIAASVTALVMRLLGLVR